MQRLSPQKMLDLQPTRKPRRDDCRTLIIFPQRRKQALLPYQSRDFVMLLFIADRAGHAAAASVEVDDFGARNAAHQAQRRSRADQGALVAVGLKEDTPGARAKL